MIAPNLVITALLSMDATVASQVTTDGGIPRIYSPRLMPGWKPIQGPAIVHSIRGGPSPSMYTPIVNPSIQITTWAATPKQCRDLQGAVYDVIHGLVQQTVSTVGGDVQVQWGKAENFPQDVVDPETGWFTVTNFYTVSLISV
jgi:hypothetical protein